MAFPSRHVILLFSILILFVFKSMFDGMEIIVVSSELPEILAISDNILVLSESKLTGKFTQAEANEEKIMHAALIEKK